MLFAYSIDPAGFLVPQELPDFSLKSDKLQAVRWFDLIHPTSEEDAFVENILGLSIPTLSEMSEIEVSSRLYSEDGAEFMTFVAVTDLDTDRPATSPITFIYKDRCLVTVRYSDTAPFRTFIQRAQKSGASFCVNAESIMLGLFDAIVDRLADALEKSAGQVDSLSAQVFRASVRRQQKGFRAVIEAIAQRSHALDLIRESLLSITRVLAYHTASGGIAGKSEADTQAVLHTQQRDVGALIEHAEYLSGRLDFVFNATVGLISTEQNQVIKLFSVASVCLMPPTLIASIYGMNFKHMPELDWALGYPSIVVLMILSAMAPFLYFKSKGWI